MSRSLLSVLPVVALGCGGPFGALNTARGPDPIERETEATTPAPLDTGTAPAGTTDTGEAPPDTAVEPSLAFTAPGAAAVNPVTFTVAATGPIARVDYLAEGTWALGSSTDAANGFPVTYRFNTLGLREIDALGYDADGALVAQANLSVTVSEAEAAGNALGVWLWYIEGTGRSHAELADELAALGVKRVYVKVADGGADCGSWPENCDATVPATYQARGLEAWAWAYNYPGSTAGQAQALTLAAESGYDGYVLDIEIEFDGATNTLTTLLSAMKDARDAAIADGTLPAGWELRATTWGNPADHGMRVDLIDRYVDAHMPQTYVEAWGGPYLADPAAWVRAGDCEYRQLGAVKPIHHIASTETGEMSPSALNTFIAASGPETSVWRVPGGGTPLSIWDDWAQVDWSRSSFDAPDCP